jgi:hypothetical protein
MSLFDSQTIFSLLITLLIGVALYYYIKYKYRVLELTQREQAKILQSVIMSMNSNNQNIMSMFQNKSQEEIISESVNNDINRFNQVNSSNELIDVSDDSDDSGSESSSESSSDGGDDSSESGESGDSGSECDHDHEVADNNTRKILFTGNNDSHLVEHLDGPDVKVIELTHPLYPKNNSEEYNNKDDGDYDDEDEDDADDDDDEDSDSESLPSDLDGHNEPNVEYEKLEKDEIREIKENVVITETNNQNTQNIQIDLETDNISEVISVENSLDNLSVKTVFKTKDNKDNKDSETHSDYNSMNVQSLRQLLKNKLSIEGSHMSEASINKLTKKDLIKNLS